MSRELDAQVAEAMGIMGWRQTARNDGVEPADGKTYPFLCNDILFTEPNQPGQRWSPSTDIAAAWQVVEHLRASNIQVHIRVRPGDLYSVCEFQVQTQWIEMHAPTAPEAICLAFLRAMGREVNR